MREISTMHLSLGSLRIWQIERNNQLQERNAMEEDPLYVAGRSSPPCITIDDDGSSMELTLQEGDEQGSNPPEFEANFQPEAGTSGSVPRQSTTRLTELPEVISDLRFRVRSLERKSSLKDRELAAIRNEITELKNQRRLPYNLRQLNHHSDDDGFSSDSSDYEYSITWPNLSKKTIKAIDRRLKTLRCRGLIYRDIVEWCAGRNIPMYAGKISKFFTKKLREETSQQMMKIISRFLKERAGGVLPDRIRRTRFRQERLPRDVRNFIEQCIMKMAERGMTNADLVDWGKEHRVVWNEVDINSFLNEKFDETRSRDMILHLEPFLEDDD